MKSNRNRLLTALLIPIIFLSSCNNDAYSKRKDDNDVESVLHVETDFNRLLSPVGLVFNFENYEISWDAVKGAANYDVNFDGKILKTTGKTSYKISNKKFEDNEKHLISVRAISEDGTIKSNYSSYLYDPSNTKIVPSCNYSLIEDTETLSVTGLNSQAPVTEELVIPEKFGNYEVVAIAEGAFKGNRNLTSITLPATIKEIGKEAFANTTKLDEINFEEGLISIKESAFEKSKISKITLPSTLKEIGDNAFNDSSVSKITFSEGITIEEIGNYAFANTNISTLTLPSSLKSLSEGLVSGSTIKTIEFPESPLYDNLPANFFKDCKRLSSFEILPFIKSLGAGIFEGCSALKTLTFQDDNQITNIPDNCFKSCNALTYVGPSSLNSGSKDKIVIIPNNVTTLGKESFYNTPANDINLINNSLEKIDDNAFYKASKIKNITLPKTLKYLGTGAFADATNLETIDYQDGTSLDYLGANALDTAKFKDNKKNAKVLSRIVFADCLYQLSTEDATKDEFVVDDNIKCIVAGLFNSNKNLTKITFGKNVKYLGENAFESCTKLTSITLPSSLISIGSSCFYRCNKIETVTIDDIDNSHLEIIGNEAFSSCNNLKSVTLPATLKHIGEKAFYMSSRFSNDQGAGNSKLETVSIPDNSHLEYIGPGAFSGAIKVSEFNLPTTLKYVGKEAFLNASSATFNGLNSESSIEYLGDNAFSGASIESFVITPKITTFGNEIFKNATKLNNLIIEDGALSFIDTLTSSMFSNCKSLESITLPDNITTIEDDVFLDCEKLLNITSSASKIAVTAFDGTAFASSFENGQVIYHNLLVSYHGNDENLVLDDDIFIINEKIFKNNKTIKTVTFNESLEIINEEAFMGAKELEEIIIPSSSSLKTIAKNAFASCKNLKTINLPNNLETLDEGAFKDCVSLNNVTINSSVLTIIPTSCFENCNALEVINLPTNIEKISDYAFNKCALINLYIPHNVKEIGNYAFANMKKDNIPSLVSLEFEDDSSLSYVGKYAFFSNSLTTILLPESDSLFLDECCFKESSKVESFAIEKAIASGGIIEGCNNIKTITLPGELSLVSLFGGKISDVSPVLKTIIVSDESTMIKDNAFSGLGMVEEIIVPDNVKEVGSYAFYGCYELSSISLLGVNSIGANAFNGCTKLENINFGPNLTSIGNKALFATEYLNSRDDQEFVIVDGILIAYNGKDENVTLPDDVKIIAGGAFSGNHVISTLNLGNNTTKLCNGALDSCTSLKTINVKSNNLLGIELGVFDTLPSGFVIYVANNKLTNYKDDIYWSLYEDNLKGN